MTRLSVSITPKTVVVAIATVVVLRKVWQKTPTWIKKRGGDDDDNELLDANDALASPTAIWSKLQEMFQLSYEMSDDLIPDDMPWYKLNACFLSLVHLQNEIDKVDPDYKDKSFGAEGDSIKIDELQVLCKYVDLAQWSYETSILVVQERLRRLNYQLIRFDTATEPGRVGHFVAVHHGTKEVVLSIKGTSTLSDALTDLIGKAIPHELIHQEIRCHEGMYTAAQMMLDDVGHLIEKFFLPQGYKFTICGHSLGAGVSCLLGIFLKDRLPKLNLQVYAFATPACLSYQASLGCQSYITSVVNNTDCVPRLSLLNLRLLHKLFMKIDSKLEEKGLSPGSFKAARSYFTDLMKYDDVLLMAKDEVTSFINTEIDKDEHQQEELKSIELFVPGRVVSVWQSCADQSVIGGRVLHGGMKVLRQLYLEMTMLGDHACNAYRDSLTTLLKQCETGASPL